MRISIERGKPGEDRLLSVVGLTAKPQPFGLVTQHPDGTYCWTRGNPPKNVNRRTLREIREAATAQAKIVWNVAGAPITPPEPRLMTAKDFEGHLLAIARKHLGLETLETRNSDGLDFHDVAVWSVREALIEAFELGRNSKS